MKVFLTACALLASLIAGAAEESAVREVVAVVPPACAPAGIKSLPNQQGSTIELFCRDDVEGEVAAIRKSDGSLYYLCEYVPGGFRPLEIPITEQIFWLNDRVFACVCSGRRYSYYALFRVDAESPVPQALAAMPAVRGVFYSKIEWKWQGNTLEGVDINGKKVITLSDYK